MRKNRLFVSVVSNIGNKRTANQDNFYLDGKTLSDFKEKNVKYSELLDDGAFAIADGMGGLKHGDYASQTAVECFGEFAADNRLKDKRDIEACVDLANTRICKKMRETHDKMGTTIAAVTIIDNKVRAYNVGDSRIYLYRDGSLTQISKDHTIIARMISANMISEEEAREDERRHQLYQNIGMDPNELAISVFEGPEFKLENDDLILMCTDGVTDSLTDKDITGIIQGNTKPKLLCSALINNAMKKGSKDNLTAMIIKNTIPKGRTAEILSWILGSVFAVIAGIVMGLCAIKFWI